MVRLTMFVMVGVLLAGCANDSGDGSFPFASTQPSTPKSAAPVDEVETEPAAPTVDDPLEVDGIVGDPCDALARDQLADLGLVGPGEPNTHGDDDGCDWRLTTSRLHIVTIRPLVSDKNGLGDVYAGRDYKDYFEETTVDGYPAVYASVLDERDSGGCTLLVGVTDDLVVSVKTSFLDVDPCPVAQKTAEAMIEHLRGGT